ncbi:MAG: hypothetical protein AB7F88_04735 [Pyrinomonadaceae bacterium]
MTGAELNKLLQGHWMSMSEEERFLTVGRLYEGEKALLESLAPQAFSKREVQEFVFYHMHGIELPPEAGIKNAA